MPSDHPNSRKTSSAKQLEEVIDHAARLLASQMVKSEVKRALTAYLRDEHGIDGVGVKTMETYLTRARDRLAEWTGKPRVEHKNDALAFYRSVLMSPDARYRDRIAAQERIDKLLGLEEPQKIQTTVKGKVSRPEEMSDEELDAFLSDAPDPAPGATLPPADL